MLWEIFFVDPYSLPNKDYPVDLFIYFQLANSYVFLVYLSKARFFLLNHIKANLGPIVLFCADCQLVYSSKYLLLVLFPDFFLLVLSKLRSFLPYNLNKSSWFFFCYLFFGWKSFYLLTSSQLTEFFINSFFSSW